MFDNDKIKNKKEQMQIQNDDEIINDDAPKTY